MENNLPLQNNTAPRPKRLLLYAHYDRDGQVDPHVVYQIKALHEFGISIIFISNSPVSEEDKGVLSPFITNMRLRPDEGYDWTAWKEALLALGIEGLSKYDELILMNDSCYGPVFPLEEMFSKMDKEDVDFWGITQSTDRQFPEHIQPYFCCIRKNVISSNSIFKFFSDLHDIKTYTDAVFNGEIAFSVFLKKQGFKCKVYADFCNSQSIPEIGINEPLVFSASSVYIDKYHVPFVKIKSFQTDFNQRISHSIDIFQALKNSGSIYPKKIIINHLRRIAPLSWQKNLPETLNVFPRVCDIKCIPDKSIAVILHLFYNSTLEEALLWLQNIPYYFDLLISCSEEIAENFMEKQKKFSLLINKTIIRVVQDRGRDVLPWLNAFKDIHLNYDIVLKFQIKRSTWLPDAVASKWNDFLVQSTLASPGYVSKIIDLFNKEKQLGMVFHTTAPVFNMYSPHGYEGCSEDRKFRKEWFQRLNLNPPEETSSYVHPVGIFWYRPQALRLLLNCEVQPCEFPPEPFPATGTIAHGLERAIPYIAQAHGYYYKLIIPDDLLINCFQLYEDSILSHYPVRHRAEKATLLPKGNTYDPCERWTPLKRKFAPLLAYLPSLFFPTTRARALYISGRKDKAIRVLNREKRRSAHAEKLLQMMEKTVQNMSVELPMPVPEAAQPVDTAQTTIRAIAYYLPQFHPFPENDAWWGKGFTEWTNVTRSQPLFQGHIQPKIPTALGYYDLRDVSVMKRQAELARQFGIFGFCFYYYYFNGKRLMEKPLADLLKNPEIDIPFCLCWANENWTRKWDGQEHDILIAQTYSPEDDIQFIKDLLPYFNDKRYIRIHGKPVLLIYNVKHFPDIFATVQRWRKTLKEEGEDVYLVLVHFYGPHDPRTCGFDAAAEFRPHELNHSWLPYASVPGLVSNFKGSVWDYTKISELNPQNHEEYTLFRGVCVNFDNTARRGTMADLFVNSSPQAYEIWFDQVCRFTHENMPSDERYVFINAWNEWAEGAILEPDKAWGFGYLNATSRVLSKYTKINGGKHD